jgi:hypothetical protein
MAKRAHSPPLPEDAPFGPREERCQAALLDIVVVAELCKHLPTLPDIVHLALCCKLLYRQVNRCYPELACLRVNPPRPCTGRKQWQGNDRSRSVMDALLQSPIIHPVVFCYCCEALLWAHMDRHSVTSTMLHIQIPVIVKALFKAQQWNLLEIFIDRVASWQRMSLDQVESATLAHRVDIVFMPEIQVVWTAIATSSLRQGHWEWFHRAAAALRAYYLDARAFSWDWFTIACPPHSISQDRRHQGYREWCDRTLIPRLLGHNQIWNFSASGREHIDWAIRDIVAKE